MQTREHGMTMDRMLTKLVGNILCPINLGRAASSLGVKLHIWWESRSTPETPPAFDERVGG